MARGGRKYPLLVYKRMLGRWWTAVFAIGLVLVLYVGLLWGAEWYFLNASQNPLPHLDQTGGLVLLVVGILAMGFGLFLLTIRNFAYLQMHDNHLRLVTPFLRLNISYKRIHHLASAEMSALFPPKKLSSWRREMLGPLLGRTANVVHLSQYPIARFWLPLFLSPFFFFDKTPHFVFLVEDWMRFSSELDSARVSGKIPVVKAKPKLTPSLLNDLNKHMK
jgi:hypothetical protein